MQSDLVQLAMPTGLFVIVAGHSVAFVPIERFSGPIGWRYESRYITWHKVPPNTAVAAPSHKKCRLNPNERSFHFGHVEHHFTKV